MNKMRLMLMIVVLVLCNMVYSQNTVPYSQRMANSQMSRSGNLYSWDYPDGLFAESILKVYNLYGEEKYLSYLVKYANSAVTSSGSMNGYSYNAFTLDNINPGKFLLELQQISPKANYKIAMDMLRKQLKNQPRTNNSADGGFWHKLSYPHQMWLDGLYMGARFYSEYDKLYNNGEAYQDVVNQFEMIHSHTYDPEYQLNYHAWSAKPDDANSFWANKSDPFLGCSKEFWGRGLGWYAAALVDVIEILPDTFSRRNELVDIFNQVAAGIKRWQDSTSGCWYQLLRYDTSYVSKGGHSNYLEASASSMYTYALLKAARLGIIDEQVYRPVGIKAYKGLLDNFITEDALGNLSLNRICRSAGLGPSSKPERNGSADYYLDGSDAGNIVSNDLKGVGPFIMASVEYEMIQGNESGMLQYDKGNSKLKVFGSNGTVTIESREQAIEEVKFFDAQGKLIDCEKGNSGNMEQFDFKVPSGIYLVRVNNLLSAKFNLSN